MGKVGLKVDSCKNCLSFIFFNLDQMFLGKSVSSLRKFLIVLGWFFEKVDDDISRIVL
jgi:hypothetical protein